MAKVNGFETTDTVLVLSIYSPSHEKLSSDQEEEVIKMYSNKSLFESIDGPDKTCASYLSVSPIREVNSFQLIRNYYCTQ